MGVACRGREFEEREKEEEEGEEEELEEKEEKVEKEEDGSLRGRRGVRNSTEEKGNLMGLRSKEWKGRK